MEHYQQQFLKPKINFNKMRKFAKISLIIAGAFFIIYSCTKENEETTQTTEKEYTYTEEAKALVKQINTFNSSLEKARKGEKDGTTMPVDLALENMELLINASHGFPFQEYCDRKVDTIKFQLPTDADGHVNMANIASAYDNMKDLVRDAYINSGYNDKGLIMVSLFIDDADKGSETVSAKAVTGKTGQADTDLFTDCWFYGENMGLCADDILYGLCDGGDTINSFILENNPINGMVFDPGPGHYIHVLQDEMIFEGYEYQDSIGEYIMFFYPDEDDDGFTIPEMQLSAAQMNQYYDNEYELIYSIIPLDSNYTFPQYCLIESEINGNQFYYSQTNRYNLRHQNVLTYAKRVWVPDNSVPAPTPID